MSTVERGISLAVWAIAMNAMSARAQEADAGMVGADASSPLATDAGPGEGPPDAGASSDAILAAPEPTEVGPIQDATQLYRAGEWLAAWVTLQGLLDDPELQDRPEVTELLDLLQSRLAFAEVVPPAPGRFMFVDGVIVHPGDGLVPVLPGEHIFSLRISGHVVARQTITLAAGESRRLVWQPFESSTRSEFTAPRRREPLPQDVADEEETEEGDEVRRGSPLRFRAGLGFGTRDFGATVVVDTRFRSPFTGSGTVAEQRDYSTSFGVRGDLELMFFPGRWSRKPILDWLGAFVRFGGLRIDALGPPCASSEEPAGGRVCDASLGLVDLEMTQRDYSMGMRVEPTFGRVTLGLGVGYDRLKATMNLDRLAIISRQAILPSMDYEALRIEADINIALVQKRRGSLSLFFAFGVLPGLSIGDDAKVIWGMESKAKVGVWGELSLIHEMAYLTEGLTIGVGARLRVARTTFDGITGCYEASGSGVCPVDALWEPWPTQDGITVAPGGGVQDDVVTDTFSSISLWLGYAL